MENIYDNDFIKKIRQLFIGFSLICITSIMSALNISIGVDGILSLVGIILVIISIFKINKIVGKNQLGIISGWLFVVAYSVSYIATYLAITEIISSVDYSISLPIYTLIIISQILVAAAEIITIMFTTNIINNTKLNKFSKNVVYAIIVMKTIVILGNIFYVEKIGLIINIIILINYSLMLYFYYQCNKILSQTLRPTQNHSVLDIIDTEIIENVDVNDEIRDIEIVGIEEDKE